MSYKDEIIDYNLHQEEIDKWISLKGEQKYMRFVLSIYRFLRNFYVPKFGMFPVRVMKH